MSTGSEALNRTVNDWLGLISSGRLRLPSFQRGTAWDRRRVQSMLEAKRNDDEPAPLAVYAGDVELATTSTRDQADLDAILATGLEPAPRIEVIDSIRRRVISGTTPADLQDGLGGGAAWRHCGLWCIRSRLAEVPRGFAGDGTVGCGRVLPCHAGRLTGQSHRPLSMRQPRRLVLRS